MRTTTSHRLCALGLAGVMLGAAPGRAHAAGPAATGLPLAVAGGPEGPESSDGPDGPDEAGTAAPVSEFDAATKPGPAAPTGTSEFDANTDPEPVTGAPTGASEFDAATAPSSAPGSTPASEPDAASVPPAPFERPPGPRRPRVQQAGFWILLGGFAVGSLAGVTVGLMERQRNGIRRMELEREMRGPGIPVSPAEQAAELRSRQRLRSLGTTTLVLGASAGALVLTSITLLLAAGPRGSKRARSFARRVRMNGALQVRF